MRGSKLPLKRKNAGLIGRLLETALPHDALLFIYGHHARHRNGYRLGDRHSGDHRLQDDHHLGDRHRDDHVPRHNLVELEFFGRCGSNARRNIGIRGGTVLLLVQ